MNVTVLLRCLFLASGLGVCSAYLTREMVNDAISGEDADPWLAYEQMPVQQPDESSPKERSEGGRGFNLMPDLRRGMSRYPGDEGKNQTKVKSAFKTSVAPAGRSTVVIQSDDKDAALGVIVAADGQILTKASELSGRIAVKLRGGKSYPATVLGASREHDLALLKIDAKELSPVTWRTGDDPQLGSFLVTSGSGDDPLAIGVLSVKARKISAPSGLLGILLEQGELGPRILRVVEGSAAEVAGLKPNDFVLQVDETKVATREALIETIANYSPGDKLKLAVKRGGQNLLITAILGKPETGRPASEDKGGKNRRPDDERLAGDLSVRRGGFPTVLQHDTVLRPYQIGGPIVDLDGRAVGLNIARADRVSTYALPTKTVVGLLADLQAGKYPAPIEIRGTDRDRLTVKAKTLGENVAAATKAKAAAEAEVAKAKKPVTDAEKIVDALKRATPTKDDEAKTAKTEKDLANAEKYLREVKKAVSAKETALKAAADSVKSAQTELDANRKWLEKLN